ncbi:MAG: protein kinase [Tannerella sp.]|jgi:serine/threonine-protein kinase|nr:protein kinase [Tannerella sp.]
MIGKEILNYRIESLIGKGGMGSVYLAVNKNINQKVAIKALNDELADSPVIREKFKQEANTLSALDHPNIVKFLNFEENEEGVFIIMEYVDGITLEEFITRKNGLIVEERAYEMFDQILSAVSYAHKRGVVHRDIKPANIILTNDNDGKFVIKILDFGIARIISESNEQEQGWIVGTPSYMSPEQVQGEDVDERSDIYSLGVLLHQMLTGRAPYDATTLSELAIKNKVVTELLPNMKEYYPRVSDKAQKIVNKATEKERDNRFQNCNDFRKTWKNAVNPDPILIPSVVKYGLVALIALLIGGGWWIWDYNRLKTYYYNDYVEVYGVPQGIEKADHKHRAKTYKFEYKKGKLRHLALVNSKGYVVFDGESERFDRPINAEFVYSGDNISYVRYLDHNDKPLFRKAYHETNGKIDMFIFQYDNGTEKYLPKDLTGYTRLENESADRGKTSRFALAFDKNGFVSALHYKNRDGEPASDKEHIYGKRYERDKKGRVQTEYYLAHNDSVTATSWGLGIKKFEYDNKDNLIKCTYLSPDGLSAYDDRNGIAIYELEYDNYGNLTYGWHKAADGSLMLPKKNQCAGTKCVYNDQGQEIETYNLGLDKEIAYSKGFFGIKREYNEYGHVTKQTYVDDNGQPFVYVDGSVINTIITDSKGNPLTVSYFDAENQPVEVEGYAKCIAEYDSLGNQASIFYYDTNDSLCITTSGYAGVRYVYNEKNKITQLTNFGTDNQPIENSNGVITIKYEYNTQGYSTKIAYYDADGQTLKLSKERIASWKLEYDDNGNETKREFFDENDNPTAGNLGYAQCEYLYDKEHGYLLEIKNLDKNKNLVYVRSDGYAGKKYKRDGRGNITEEYPYDTNGRLVAGEYIERKKYDDHDNLIERTYFDANENKTLLNGYHKLVSKYDERNQETEANVYGLNGEFVNTPQGYSTMKVKRDNRGNITEYATYNTSQQLVSGTNEYAVRKIEYDAMSRIIKETYFDANGQPTNPSSQIPERIYGYDHWGNNNYYALADGKGNLINHPKDAWAIQRYEYNIRSELLEIRNYDKNEKPCVNKGYNYYKRTYIYDKQGNTIESRYYDTDGNLRKNDQAIERSKYNEQGKQTEWAKFNDLDKAADFNGYHKSTVSYDEAGNYQYRKYYAASDKLLQTQKYNPQTNDWDVVGSQPDPPAKQDWITFWRQIKCPYVISDEIEGLSIAVGRNSCNITIRYLEISKYDISDTNVQKQKEWAQELAKLYKKESGMPGNTTLTIIGVDKAKRELYRITNK